MLVPDWIFIRYASHLSFPLNSNSYPQMKHKFIMMEIEAGLWGVVPTGSVCTLPPSKKDCLYNTPSSHEEGHYYTTVQQPTAHLTPVPFIQKHALNIFTMYRTAISRPANKCIYKYIQFCIYRTNEKEGNRNYRNGDLTKDVSTWSSTYIKTSD